MSEEVAPCRLGYEEYDGARYCFEHAGFLEAGVQSRRCDRAWGDADLPGMWSRSDFMGGDPDERSYAERARNTAAPEATQGEGTP